MAPPRAELVANAETRNRLSPGSVTPSLVLDRREVTQKGQEAVTQVTMGICFGPGGIPDLGAVGRIRCSPLFIEVVAKAAI